MALAAFHWSMGGTLRARLWREQFWGAGVSIALHTWIQPQETFPHSLQRAALLT